MDSKDILLRQLLAKNHILNGGMEIFQQKGFSAIGIGAAGDDIADQFRAHYANLDDVNISTQHHTLDDGVSSCLQLNINIPESDVASDEYFLLQHRVEGYNFRHLFGKDLTFTFRVSSPTAGTYYAYFGNYDMSKSFVAEYVIATANVEQEVVINIPAHTAGTWDFENGTGLIVTFVLANGLTAYQTDTIGSWQDGQKWCKADQVNGFSVGGAFKLGAVALYEGTFTKDTLPEFRTKHQSYQKELAECKRYYQLISAAFGKGLTGGKVRFSIHFPVEMRAVPSVGATGVLRITDETTSDYIQSVAHAAIASPSHITNKAARIGLDNFAVSSAGQYYNLIPTISPNNSIYLDARLS